MEKGMVLMEGKKTARILSEEDIRIRVTPRLEDAYMYIMKWGKWRMFNKDDKKTHIRINMGLTEEQTKRLRKCIITYSVIGILWTLLAPWFFLGLSWFATLVFYVVVNPIAVLVICRFFAQDNEGGSMLFLVLLLIEITGCFLLFNENRDWFSEYWWILIIYFICGKIGMKLY